METENANDHGREDGNTQRRGPAKKQRTAADQVYGCDQWVDKPTVVERFGKSA